MTTHRLRIRLRTLRLEAQSRPGLITASCCLVLALSFILSINLGSSGWSLAELWQALMAPDGSDDQSIIRSIFLDIRLPRIIVAALCGACLAAAGVLSQGLFRNSLAGPSVLGTEAGASLAAVFVFYTGSAYQNWLFMPLAAFTGALLVTAFVLRFSTRQQPLPIASLLLAGFTLNAVCGALSSLIISLSLDDYQKTTKVMHWLMGGFSGKGWEHVLLGIPALAIGCVLAYRLTPKLDVLALGADLAQTLSIDHRRLRRGTIIALAILIAGAITAGSPLPFVGLIIPHATRLIAGPAHRRLLLLSMVNGMSLAMMADVFARTVRAPGELDVGILTSLLGAPFFLWLLLRRSPEGES